MSAPTIYGFTQVTGRARIPRSIRELQAAVRSAGLSTDGDIDTAVTTRGTTIRLRRRITGAVQQGGSTIPRWG